MSNFIIFNYIYVILLWGHILHFPQVLVNTSLVISSSGMLSVSCAILGSVIAQLQIYEIVPIPMESIRSLEVYVEGFHSQRKLLSTVGIDRGVLILRFSSKCSIRQ